MPSSGAIDFAPDNFAVPGPIVPKPQRDYIPLGDCVRPGGNSTVFKMISVRRRPTSKSSTPKRSVAPADLAERFLQVQRLRKQVHDLEQLAATDHQRAFAATGDGRGNERE